ncbi:MAG: MFS transporter [Ignisphaera sp.]|nr:MFS transporter [Ignisphaera sp.]
MSPRAIIIITFIINTLLMAISGVTYPVIPLYIVGSGLGVITAGMVTSIASITSFCSQIIWGYMSDRIGRRSRIMLYGSIIMLLFYTMGTILSDNILAIELSYIFSTIGGAGVGVASYALIADMGPRNLGRNMSLYWAGGSLGWATPLLFAGWLLKTYGVVSVFMVSLLLSAAILILVLVLMHTDKHAPIAVSTRQSRWSLRPIIRLLSNKTFLVLYTSSFVFMVGDVIKNIYIPQYLAYKIGLGESMATAILSLASWFEIPAILLFGHILGIVGGTPVYMLGLASMAAYLYLNSTVRSFAAASIVMAGYSIVWSSYITSISVLVPLSVDEENKGLALGLVNSNFALANILSNIALSYMVDAYGYSQTFVVISALILVLTLAVGMGLRHRSAN